MGLGSGGLCGCQSEAGWPQQEPGVGRAPHTHRQSACRTAGAPRGAPSLAAPIQLIPSQAPSGAALASAQFSGCSLEEQT